MSFFDRLLTELNYMNRNKHRTIVFGCCRHRLPSFTAAQILKGAQAIRSKFGEDDQTLLSI